MRTNPVAKQQHETAGTSSAPMTQAGRMRAAVEHAIALGPAFLRGDVDANHMATTMVEAVRNYVEQERTEGSGGSPRTAESQTLQGALTELMTCGSGYLAGQCDAACVARTITQMVDEFRAA